MNKISSIKVILRKDKKADNNGKLPLALQIIISSKSKKNSLKEKIQPEFWDFENSKAKGREFKYLNAKLDKIKSDVQTFAIKNEAAGISVTFDLIDNHLKGKVIMTFFSYLMIYLQLGLSKKQRGQSMIFYEED